MDPVNTYLQLMAVIRERFDAISALRASGVRNFPIAETVAFHARKIMEATAFACLVAIDNTIKHVPHDARGKWNAEEIFKSLKKKGLDVLPIPCNFRRTTPEERQSTGSEIVVLVTQDARLGHDELIRIYSDLHVWLHEINPYTGKDRASHLETQLDRLWADVLKLERLLDRHFITLNTAGFVCLLRNRHTGQTQVIPIGRTPP